MSRRWGAGQADLAGASSPQQGLGLTGFKGPSVQPSFDSMILWINIKKAPECAEGWVFKNPTAKPRQVLSKYWLHCEAVGWKWKPPDVPCFSECQDPTPASITSRRQRERHRDILQPPSSRPAPGPLPSGRGKGGGGGSAAISAAIGAREGPGRAGTAPSVALVWRPRGEERQGGREQRPEGSEEVPPLAAGFPGTAGGHGGEGKASPRRSGGEGVGFGCRFSSSTAGRGPNGCGVRARYRPAAIALCWMLSVPCASSGARVGFCYFLLSVWNVSICREATSLKRGSPYSLVYCLIINVKCCVSSSMYTNHSFRLNTRRLTGSDRAPRSRFPPAAGSF